MCLFTSTLFAQHVYPQTSGGGSSFDIISPATLTAAANDWNPSGLSTADVIRLSGDDQFRIISGIDASVAGDLITLTNVGSWAVLLSKEDGASTAANRFNMYRDYVLYPDNSITLYYDATTTRWRFMDAFPMKIIEGKQLSPIYTHGGSVVSGDYDAFVFTTASGSFTTNAPEAALQRRVIVSTAASASSTPNITHKGASSWVGKTSGIPNSLTTRVVMSSISALSDGTNTYTIIAGMPASVTSSTPDGAYFKYSDGINGGKWACVTRTGGSETLIDSGVTVAVSTVYYLDVFHRPDNSVAFFINNTFVGESTTNVHDGFVFNSFGMIKSLGTTARTSHLIALESVESRR